MFNLLQINNLYASIQNKLILKNLNLKIKKGEIHAIMGPNGSGKSTLSKILSGHPAYNIQRGNIIFKGFNILNIKSHYRSHLGIFLAFQYPIEIPGVSNIDFLRLSYNSKQKFYNKSELTPINFLSFIHSKLRSINMSYKFLDRNVNEGFSGGEKKKNEILQMILLDPDLIILDETDSGLDVDSLKLLTKNINYFMNKSKSILLITHYRRLLHFIKPQFIHVMKKGKILKKGTYQLAEYIEKEGYMWF
uniref:Iron-sulfur cluster formation ABC transporter ATP-binding subunit n=1 Tax=Nitzschia sp. IriIs04 TaxID=1444690 RepID=A0A0S3QPL1_9STRA|nr:iron-sulfur cluster formation ABC transporter ATP-binding subunit [Nitzschia sp. IriIs04]BAT70269.1 iron-sulfur cluster formation ABC transporter ATP-binding subunit [Nitzschia sp. IriIs04]